MRPLKGKHLTTMCDTCRSEKTLPHTSCTQFHFSHRGFVPRSRIIPAVRADRCRATRTESKLPFIRVRIFSACYFPLTGGAAVTTSDHRERRGGLWQLSIRARVTHRFVAPSHTCAATTSLLHSHKSARISRNISPILRETWSCGTRLVFSQKLFSRPPRTPPVP